jgi:hypothetical protein
MSRFAGTPSVIIATVATPVGDGSDSGAGTASAPMPVTLETPGAGVVIPVEPALIIPTRLSEASINSAAGGANVLVAGVAGQKVYVFRLFFVAGAATTIILADTVPTILTGPMQFEAGGSLLFGEESDPWFTTTTGAGFIYNTSNAVQVSGRIYYIQK